MSVYEWSAGSIKLPTGVLPKMLKDFQVSESQLQSSAFDHCQTFWRELPKRAKTDFEVYSKSRSEYLYTLHDSSEFGFLPGFVKRDTSDLRWEIENQLPWKARRLLKTDVNWVNSKTIHFSNGDLELDFNRKLSKVNYYVPENNHARDHAGKSRLHRRFMDWMGSITWTSRSGGVIVGNDEYNQCGDGGLGGGGNYLVYAFGDVGVREAKRYGLLV